MSQSTTTAESRKLPFYAAMVEAIRQEMQRDSSVFCLGEDVGQIGGVFQSTVGLFKEFGAQRVRDTPISETAILGTALGAAAQGMRPIAELMFVDFMGVCFDQILNNISKTTYMSGGAIKLPLVITASTGGGICDAAQHSQTLHGYFAHTPGIKVVMPSNPYDAKGLMTTAIRDDSPVVYLFHRALLGLPVMNFIDARFAEEVPEESYSIPFGQARRVREGSDVTVVAFSQMVPKALVAAGELAAKGISVELLDPRTLVPLDMDAIFASLEKTGRLLVVDEDYLSFGVTGEIIARVAEQLDRIKLKAPPRRLAIPDVSIPYSPALESAVIPQSRHIVAAVEELMTFNL
ncbi:MULTISPECIES: alpha-ketoacid dehydrogenase subunit beta [Pseudomonas]|jgi:pyruvate/2-oxoglutarate/acetoin dehydrogenase E1 component|uniref:2-oxoisovalerate dehydrogenase subunit beta n=1 Tax=Pseudomonas kielensis TaxID=2762577 RepID=A0A7X1GAD4_9PSED|nr:MULTISPECIES: alpha-ketoacid dehydrogenase subunit beta [Pseudomonas]MBC2688830.1 alpha-ketoacid dehydrogenase subunit beta [Pseudomonas kielensis]NBB35146.1 alpha-ketoacid dehydrogenase subunit beta [Pseudomonas sp. BC115LW]UZM15097.1 alpha-ketoacid dehydrogenase subunit beta [Pseudomonas kielensis]WKL52760.1 alpha-ketoacid dehydrogenase subunit beta [Pseudomonas kielensis]